MNRIDKKFKELKEKGKKAMIPFLTAGDPSLEGTVELVLELEKSGADIVELGIPYSDPTADGPIIQASSHRALKNGVKITKVMDVVKSIRKSSEVPIIYLVYYNSIFKYGIEKFLKEASISGVDGLIIPDLPIEERAEIISIAKPFDIYLIPLVAPTSRERIKKITKGANGFVYCVAVNGITGVRKEISTNIEEYMKEISSFTSLPKALGFGISSKEMAREFSKYCEGIIVGSAVVKKVGEGEDLEDSCKKAGAFISEIKEALQ